MSNPFTTLQAGDLDRISCGLDVNPAKRVLARGFTAGAKGAAICFAAIAIPGAILGSFNGVASGVAGAGVGGAIGAIGCGAAGFTSGVITQTQRELRR